MRSEPRVTTQRTQPFRCVSPCLPFSTVEVCALSSLSLRHVFKTSYVAWIRPVSSVDNSTPSSNYDSSIYLNRTVAMSSWSAPVYPRRSRSRSPYRGYAGRPPHPDPYSGDPYRPEWDAYDRDRWAGYERERGPHDYGRRGRSRSPDDGTALPTQWRRGVNSFNLFTGAGRKRRRSTSPWDRERYEPRPRYDDYGMFTSRLNNVVHRIEKIPQTPTVEGIHPEGHSTLPDLPHKTHIRSTTPHP